MATPYDNIHTRVVRKIRDRNILNLDAPDQEDYFDGLLFSALVNFKTSEVDLYNRDEIEREFIETLSELEEEILALYEVVEWTIPYLNSIDLIKQNMSTTDYKLSSQANHLKELRNLHDLSLLKAQKLRRDYTFRTHSLDDLD